MNTLNYGDSDLKFNRDVLLLIYAYDTFNFQTILKGVKKKSRLLMSQL